jgi:predicted transcriptional regulator
MKIVTTKTKAKIITVRFSTEQNQMIDNCAKVNNVSKSRIINQAVTEFFE